MRYPFFLLIVTLFLNQVLAQETANKASEVNEKELVEYLTSHWQNPEDYVASKFSDHDIVFIGEMHRIQHDVELIHNLIPRLYKIGVYNLGIEFGGSEYQGAVDSLVTGDTYNESTARWLLFKWAAYWGFKEYMDIYKKAWELNKSLPMNAPKFRVVHLNYIPRWNLVKEEMTADEWKQVLYKGDGDEFMANVILKEFVGKGLKALIYSGAHHAFTRYQQPLYDYANKKFLGFNTVRMGNAVHAKIPDKVFNIFLHSPWPSKASFDFVNYPVRAVIDKIMKNFSTPRIGFDVQNSPFAELRDDSAYYAIGYKDFKLGTFCDGCIFQKQLKDYKGCTVDSIFVTKENLQEAIEHLPNAKVRKFYKSQDDYLRDMKNDTDMPMRFRDLK